MCYCVAMGVCIFVCIGGYVAYFCGVFELREVDVWGKWSKYDR